MVYLIMQAVLSIRKDKSSKELAAVGIGAVMQQQLDIKWKENTPDRSNSCSRASSIRVQSVRFRSITFDTLLTHAYRKVDMHRVQEPQQRPRVVLPALWTWSSLHDE